MKAIDKEIYDILNEYLFDITKVGYFKNMRGIEVASFDDNSDNHKIYMEKLKEIGFERVFLNELSGEEYLMSEKYLCSISFCDNELWLVYYKDIKEYLSEKQEAKSYCKEDINNENIKKFNINNMIYIKILPKGWEYLNTEYGQEMVETIKSRKIIINGEEYYGMFCYNLFDMFPSIMECDTLFEPNILFNNNDLKFLYTNE